MHPTLERPIVSDYVLLRDLTPLALVTLIVKTAQSKRDLNLQDQMSLYTSFITLPVGAGENDAIADYTKKLRSVIKIENTDNLCLFRAIVVGMAYADMKANPNNKTLKLIYYNIVHKHRRNQTNEAVRLCQKVLILNQ